MEYLIGAILSLAVAGLVRIVGLDRDRGFYPTVTIVVASYYVLFATMAASNQALLAEIGGASLFLLLAVLGFKTNLWIAAIALTGHGIFDSVHHWLIENPGMPRWWPGFCGTFDVIFGGLFAVLLIQRRVATR